MELTLSGSIMKDLAKSLKDTEVAKMIPEFGFDFSRRSPNTEYNINVSVLSSAGLTRLRDALKEHDPSTSRRLSRLINLLDDSTNKVVRDLNSFPKVFEEWLKSNTKGERPWLFSTKSEFQGIAYLPESVRFVHGRNYGSDSYVSIDLVYNHQRRYSTRKITISRSDLGRTVPEIIKNEGFALGDQDTFEFYDKCYNRFREYSTQQGEQFRLRREAPVEDRSLWWDSQLVNLSLMGKPTKGVLDMEYSGSATHRSATETDIFGRVSQPVPTHPVLRFFSLKHHKYVWTNVYNATPYKYEDGLIEKLVLPPSHSKLIGALVNNLEVLRDEKEAEDRSRVFESKNQSSIILAVGPPGTGKTLTAEVYAEEIKRPLYEVHSGQLGSDAETIEANLTAILDRSLRLRMPLVINEADTFIKERGDDFVQVAICAVFLRLLEYHNGLVFLTSNIDKIDDAIRSRCLAEIRYTIPSDVERERIWHVQLKEFNVELSKADVKILVRKMPSIVGRDIQNLVRLTNRVCKAIGEPFSTQAILDNAPFRGVKVLEGPA